MRRHNQVPLTPSSFEAPSATTQHCSVGTCTLYCISLLQVTPGALALWKKCNMEVYVAFQNEIEFSCCLHVTNIHTEFCDMVVQSNRGQWQLSCSSPSAAVLSLAATLHNRWKEELFWVEEQVREHIQD